MDRQWESGAAGAPPPPTNASAGYATAGNPGGGVPATKPGAHWYHMVTEEILSVIAFVGTAFDKTVVTQLRDAIIAIAASLGGQKNLVLNGGCVVAQRAAVNLSTTAAYGQVDQFAFWATGTAVTAGTIIQDSAAVIGRMGYAAQVSGATVTGAGVVLGRHRIESAKAKRLKNRNASFSVVVHQDTGGPVNYTITLRKANAADNFTATTQIAASAALPVPNNAGTTIKLENVAMGDCSNGIEIEVSAACGAIVTKNFRFTEWQLEDSVSATRFDYRDVHSETRDCTYYFRPSVQIFSTCNVTSGNSYEVSTYFEPMRATPTASNVAFTNNTGAATLAACTPKSRSVVDFSWTAGTSGAPSQAIKADLSAEL